jgi:hypothetical protein
LTQLLGMLLGAFRIIFFIGLFIVPAVWLWTVIDGIVLMSPDARRPRTHPSVLTNLRRLF